jgi:hypothetical protein
MLKSSAGRNMRSSSTLSSPPVWPRWNRRRSGDSCALSASTAAGTGLSFGSTLFHLRFIGGCYHSRQPFSEDSLLAMNSCERGPFFTRPNHNPRRQQGLTGPCRQFHRTPDAPESLAGPWLMISTAWPAGFSMRSGSATITPAATRRRESPLPLRRKQNRRVHLQAQSAHGGCPRCVCEFAGWSWA